MIKRLIRIKIKSLFYLFLSSTFILFICPLVAFLLNPNQVEMRTLEMAPEGPVLMELTNQSSRSVRARWTAPPSPNGNLSYTLYYRSKGDTRRCSVSFSNTKKILAQTLMVIAYNIFVSIVLTSQNKKRILCKVFKKYCTSSRFKHLFPSKI